MDRSYKDLMLKIDGIETVIEQFFKKYPQYKLRDYQNTTSKKILKFGYVGQDDALVNLYVKSKGTTVQFKTGKNQELGKIFADYLYQTIDSNEKTSVNLSLKGFDLDYTQLLVDELNSIQDKSGEKEFEITKHSNKNSNRYEVRSVKYKDRLVVTHHLTTDLLQVQGKPLFCYRNFSYIISDFLDQETLFSVISKTDDNEKRIIHQEVAQGYIQRLYVISFPRMQEKYKDLLISSYCVKLSAPTLPEYSMLLYPDLRVLEGVIKEFLLKHGKATNSAGKQIGYYFSSNRKIREEHKSDFDDEKSIAAIEACYQFYVNQRHSLFHMNDITVGSRTIDSLTNVMSLSDEISQKIESIYDACQRL